MEKTTPFRLTLHPQLNREAAALAIELALFIGFRSDSLCFPFAAAESGVGDGYELRVVPAPAGYSLTREGTAVCLSVGPQADRAEIYRRFTWEFDALFPGYEHNPRAVRPENYLPAPRRQLPPFDKRPVRGLESFFEKDYVLLDEDFDLLPDKLALRLLLPLEPSAAQVRAACDLAARLGLETLGISYPFVLTTDDGRGDLLMLEAGEDESFSYRQEGDRRLFVLRGREDRLPAFTAAFCNQFPLAPASPSGCLLSVTERLAESLSAQDLDGQLAWLEGLRSRLPADAELSCFFSPAALNCREELEQRYPGTSFSSYLEPVEVESRRFELPWEVDTLRKLFASRVLSRVKPGDRVELEAVVSEDAEVRRSLRTEFTAAVAKRGGQLVSSRLVCAYKPGLSWLSEYVAPQLDGEQLGRLLIRFCPLLSQGQENWAEAAGATPSYHLDLSEGQPISLDPPLRPMMELYPCDDVLAGQLHISREKIVFEQCEDQGGFTYEAIAEDEQGRVMYRDTWTNRYHERFLLDEFPQAGLVHPFAAWLKASVNGETVVDESFNTDHVEIWNCFQQEALPYFGRLVRDRSQGCPSPELQPYFSQMKLEATASEPEYELSFREGIISSLCGLSEDFYYVGLEYFKLLGQLGGQGQLDAPGLILPIVKAAPGPPTFRFTHLDQAAPGPMIRHAGGDLLPAVAKKELSIHISQVRGGEEGLELVFDLEGPGLDPELVQGLARVISAGLGEVHQLLAGYSRVIFRVDGREYPAQPPAAPALPPLDIRQVDIKEGQIIGYQAYMEVMEQLKRVPGLRVFKAGESYLGRDIYGIELKSSRPGYTSHTKLLNRNPSWYVNNRHHANEVSSTNAVFLLLRQLLIDPTLAGLDQRLNLVLVPMENPDGAEVHYQLQRDNPHWTLHCARFSGIGREFYYEHFNDDTIHVEALPLTRLWRKWLPDVLTDNHGVSVNEGDEQFFGYVNPSYRGFWLPRSLIYGYFWCVEDGEYSMNIPLNQAYQEVVADVFQADGEITALNLEWQDRFKKYAHRWMPKTFPAEYYRDMINYWIYYPYDPLHRYTSVRFPWITTVNYTSEIADECAQGDYLKLCSRTHALHNRAALDLLLGAGCVYEDSRLEEGDSLTLRRVRRRPIIIQPV